MKNRFFPAIISLMLALIATSAGAYDFKVGQLCYLIKSDNRSVSVVAENNNSPHYSSLGSSVTIPSTVSYGGKTYTVTTISSYAFEGCTDLAEITVPASVLYIGQNAFENTRWYANQPYGVVYAGRVAYRWKGSMPAGTTVSIQSGTKGIAESAFASCKQLAGVTFPSTLTTIGASAFSGCSTLTSVTIPNSVETIGSRAFYYCSALSTINFPNSVTSLGSEAFYQTAWYSSQPDGPVYLGNVFYYWRGSMPSYTTVDIRQGTKVIADGALASRGVAKVNFPNTLTHIGKSAFSRLTDLQEITIPNSVVSIDNDAFSDCSMLSSVTVPNSVTFLGSGVFSSCSNMYSAVLPSSLTKIPSSTFSYCDRLNNISIPGNVTEIGAHAFRGCKGMLTITIPGSVAVIGESAFENSGLRQITLPNSLVTIGKEAFYDCTSLTAMEIPNSVKTIGDKAFFSCTSLQSVSLGSSLSTIGADAFRQCGALSAVTIPASVTTIGDGAFYLCSAMKTLTFNSNCAASIGTSAFQGCYGLTNVVIPGRIRSVGNNAFQSCKGLRSVSVGNGVTSIGSEAFHSCDNLTTISLGTALTTIGDRAFYNCGALTGINFPVALTSIGESAFHGAGLTSVSIPKNVNTIGSSAFYNCEFLNTITVDAANTTYDSRDNCNALIKTSSNMLIKGCRSTIVPNTVKEIGNYAFHNTPNLSSIEIPNSVTRIGVAAFRECPNLNEAVIGKSVTDVGNEAFSGCGLLSITCKAVTPPTAYSKTFENVPLSCKLIVPVGSGNLYRTANYWKVFTNISEADFTEPLKTTLGFDMSTIKGLSVGQSTGWLPVTLTRVDNLPNFTEVEFTIILPKGLKATAISPDSDTEILISGTNKQLLSWDAQWNAETGVYHCVATNATNTPITKNPLQVCRIRLTKESEPEAESTIQIADLIYTTPDGNRHAWLPAGGRPENKGYAFPMRNPDGTKIIPGYGEVFSANGVWYLKNANGTAVSVTSNLYRGNVTIPQSVSYGGKNYPVTAIGQGAFYDCYELTAISLPNSITSIGGSAFSYCQALKEINIPQSVTSIGSFALFECSALNRITVDPANTVYDSRDNCNAVVKTSSNNLVFGCNNTTIPATVASINNFAFQSMSGLKQLRIPKSVKTIGYASMRYCTGLSALDIPKSVTSIGGYAFFGCTGLAQLTIGEKAATIVDNAFSNCSSLTAVTVKMKTPPTISNTIFANVDKRNCTLYVPTGSADLYRAANDWSGFSTIVEKPMTDGDVNGDGSIDVDDVNSIINMVLGLGGGEGVDVNGDGSVDIFDINMIINLVLGIN